MEMQMSGDWEETASEANSYALHGVMNLYGLMSIHIPSVTLPNEPSSPAKKGASGEDGSDTLCELEPGPSDAHVSSV